MGRRKKCEIEIDVACPHTIKKFELIEAYVKAWSEKLLQYGKCDGIVFIDCMCNSGIYTDSNGEDVYGTPIRISKLLSNTMKRYPDKQAKLYFNDLSEKKILVLKSHLPGDTNNFHIYTATGDGNAFLKNFTVKSYLKLNYLLVYDPYTASIAWDALQPFLNIWGEVIINHMVSDTIRGVSQAKNPIVIAKYEETYKASIDELMANSDRDAYEQRIKNIITAQQHHTNRDYYVSSFPFFNRTNALVYNLLHCSSNIEGRKLFKKTAWDTFGGKSSLKNTHGTEDQFILDLDGDGEVTTITDEYCYYAKDIAKYIFDKFRGTGMHTFNEVFGTLDDHPVFPSDGYRREIKEDLRTIYNVSISKSTLTFS